MDSAGIRAVLAEIRSPQFLTHWGKSAVYLPGELGRFADLLPWSELNRILRQHRLEPPRLRLVREGKAVPVETYLAHTTGSRPGQRPIPRLNLADFIEQLRLGATLVVDAVEEVSDPITLLADHLQEHFQDRVQVNLYAGWRTSRGFDLHWDDHDVLILQVAGRKDWTVYGPSRRYPLKRDFRPDDKPPADADVIWAGTLNDGDALYIPRGWWHVAIPLEQPTLHLTCGIQRRTGIDLAGWLVDQLREREEFRRDLPSVKAPTAEIREHMGLLLQQLLAEWDNDLFRRYAADFTATARQRLRYSLPWAPTPEVFPRDESAPLRFNWLPRCTIDSVAPNEDVNTTPVRLAFGGKVFKFSPSTRTILGLLAECRTIGIGELVTAARGIIDTTTLYDFLAELVINGIVSIETEREPH